MPTIPLDSAVVSDYLQGCGRRLPLGIFPEDLKMSSPRTLLLAIAGSILLLSPAAGDSSNDPLPPYATVRLGLTRLRHGQQVSAPCVFAGREIPALRRLGRSFPIHRAPLGRRRRQGKMERSATLRFLRRLRAGRTLARGRRRHRRRPVVSGGNRPRNWQADGGSRRRIRDSFQSRREEDVYRLAGLVSCICLTRPAEK